MQAVNKYDKEDTQILDISFHKKELIFFSEFSKLTHIIPFEEAVRHKKLYLKDNQELFNTITAFLNEEINQ